jgi:hypothetical protein
LETVKEYCDASNPFMDIGNCAAEGGGAGLKSSAKIHHNDPLI